MNTLSGMATWSKLFYLSSEKGSTLKRKNLFPLRPNSFLLEWITLGYIKKKEFAPFGTFFFLFRGDPFPF